ncbi:hypothetical protein OG589_13820 [Sphaerisporangium sp. NBC_01403]|uniref:hypothetical protein n=1 Tax=Sphaerisporangium sp. NBC_01403 TaxID=2903599 RepID=UPI0032472F18
MAVAERGTWAKYQEATFRASAVLALNLEDLDLPNKQARIVAKSGDIMWITWGTDMRICCPG